MTSWAPGGFLGTPWGLLAASWEYLGVPWGLLGAPGVLLEGPWELLGALLGASCDLRGLSWELLLAAWASLGGSWGPLAEKMQNERVKSTPPGLGFRFDVVLIKSCRPKVNEMEDSMSN